MDKIELYCDLIKINCKCKACGLRESFTSEGKCECGRENKMLKKILPKLRKELANSIMASKPEDMFVIID